MQSIAFTPWLSTRLCTSWQVVGKQNAGWSAWIVRRVHRLHQLDMCKHNTCWKLQVQIVKMSLLQGSWTCYEENKDFDSRCHVAVSPTLGPPKEVGMPWISTTHTVDAFEEKKNNLTKTLTSKCCSEVLFHSTGHQNLFFSTKSSCLNMAFQTLSWDFHGYSKSQTATILLLTKDIWSSKRRRCWFDAGLTFPQIGHGDRHERKLKHLASDFHVTSCLDMICLTVIVFWWFRNAVSLHHCNMSHECWKCFECSVSQYPLCSIANQTP